MALAQASGRNLTGSGQTGPVVRVVRGKQASEVAVGSASGTGGQDPEGAARGLLDAQANGMRGAGRTVPAAGATLIK
jgi:hypothetical protein